MFNKKQTLYPGECSNCYALPGDKHAWGCPNEPPSVVDVRDEFLIPLDTLSIENQLMEEHF